MTTPSIAESIEESLILTLVDVANHLTRNGERLAQREGLTAQQWLLLLQIAGDANFPRHDDSAADDAPVVASAIATARGVSRPTISALVSALVHKGLVSQTDDPLDRRQKTLRVTARGLAVLQRMEPARQRANQALLAEFSERELQKVLLVLRSCLATLWRQGSAAARGGRRTSAPPGRPSK